MPYSISFKSEKNCLTTHWASHYQFHFCVTLNFALSRLNVCYKLCHLIDTDVRD